MAATEALPLKPEDVTAEWLAPKLGLTKAAVKVDKTLHGTATKVLMTVTPEGEAGADKTPIKVCLKGGFNPAMVEALPFVVSLYHREVDFYTRLAPKVPALTLPKVLWAGSDAKNGVLVMENLEAEDGFEFADPVNTWSVARVTAAVEELAALHAGTWGTQAADAPWLDAHYEASVLHLCASWDAIVLGGDRPPVSDYMRNGARMTAAYKKWFATRNPRFRCVLHGDSHLGNAGWSAARGAPMFVDWQIIHLGSCFADVAYFVTSALTVEDRRAHEMEILDHYLATLKARGGPALSRDDKEVMDEYRKSLMAVFSWVVCPYAMQTKERVWAVVSRAVPAMNDHKTVELLESS